MNMWSKLLMTAILYFTYMLLGGVIFSQLERSNELQSNQEKADLQALLESSLTASNYTLVYNQLGSSLTETNNWEYSGACVFSLTVMTTIGYGVYAPETLAGRIIVIFYGLCGIALTGHIFKVWGSTMVDYFHRKTLSLKYFQEDTKKNPSFSAWKLELYIALGLFVLILLIMAGIFSIIEEWNFFESMYFTFITISTIGFGDFVPNNREGRIFLICFILIGLTIWAELLTLLVIRIQKSAKGLEERVSRFAVDE